MDTPIRISDRMTNPADGEVIRESRVVRVPKDARKHLGYNLGDFISLRTRDGALISLQVEPAYDEDVKSDSLTLYLAKDVFDRVATVYSQSCDVQLVDGITLGCDPELMVIDRTTGNLISAQYFFGLNKWDAVGFDGLLLEYRPAPSVDETVVIDNIYNLIAASRHRLNACAMFPNLMLAGISSFHGGAAVAKNIKTGAAVVQPGAKLTAGFHLHYGLPNIILGYQKKFVAQQIVKALDYYVGIPSIIPEGNTDSYRRTVQGLEYGKPGMFRLDNRTLEYRTPGAALMKHPVLARGLIGLGAVVIEDIVSRVGTITDSFTKLSEISTDADIRILYPNIPPVMEIFSTICSPTVDSAKRHFEQIRYDVEKMVGFARRAESINNFFDNIGTEFSIDVEENWRRETSHGERQSG
jgi:hypothetical protein